MNDVTAVILCGGQGTRLRSVIGDLPKCLAPVAGKPFLQYQFDYLIKQGIRRIVLCTGYGAAKVDYFCGMYWWDISRSGAKVNFCHSMEKGPLGTGGALKNALPHIDSDPVLVLNGDTFCRTDLTKFYDEYKQRRYPIGRLVDPSPWHIDTGIRLVTKTFIKLIPEGVEIDLDEILRLFAVIATGVIIADNSFIDIGTPENYAKAEDFLREQGVIT